MIALASKAYRKVGRVSVMAQFSSIFSEEWEEDSVDFSEVWVAVADVDHGEGKTRYIN